jgi:CheY-like chemotaxis protein
VAPALTTASVRRCFAAPEALDALRQWRPDVLVSDIEMPGEDGDSLIRKVRALDPAQGGRTPAIALTAYGRTQDRILSLAAATACTSRSRSMRAS